MAAGLEWKGPKCAIIKDCKGDKLLKGQKKKKKNHLTTPQQKIPNGPEWANSNLASKLVYSQSAHREVNKGGEGKNNP